MSKRNWVWCWACMFLVVFASQALAQNLPSTSVSWGAEQSDPPYGPGPLGSYADIYFSGIGAGYDVVDGVHYRGWCIANIDGVPPVSVKLINPLDPQFASLVGEYLTAVPGHLVNTRVPWNELNWLLNNRSSFVDQINTTQGMHETEYAIQMLMYGTVWGPHTVGATKGNALLLAAQGQSSFIPGPNDLVAVMLYREGSTPFADLQDVIIELPIPKPIHLKCASCFGDAAKIDIPYSETMIVTGGVAPYTFSIVGGSLPDGLGLNSSTGEISGIPTKVGFFVVKIKVEDFQGNSDTAICWIIVTKPCIRLDCGDCYSKTGYVGTAFSHRLYVAGGVAPFTFSVVSGSLPRGLTLNPSTGVISGTPDLAGTFNFTVKVVDSRGTSDTDSCSIVIRGPSIVLSCTSCGSTAKVGVDYYQQLKVSGGTAPYTFSIVSGTLPPGLQLGSSSGKITGKPTTAGKYTFKARVDSHGSYDTVWCTIEVVRRCW